MAAPAGGSGRHAISEHWAKVRAGEAGQFKQSGSIKFAAGAIISAPIFWYIGAHAPTLNDSLCGCPVAFVNLPANFTRTGRIDFIDWIATNVDAAGSACRARWQAPDRSSAFPVAMKPTFLQRYVLLLFHSWSDSLRPALSLFEDWRHPPHQRFARGACAAPPPLDRVNFVNFAGATRPLGQCDLL